MNAFTCCVFALVVLLLNAAEGVMGAFTLPDVKNHIAQAATIVSKLPQRADHKLGLSVGTTPGGNDVIFHDEVAATFMPAEEMVESDIYTVGPDVDFVTFYAVREGKPLTLQKPVLVVTSEFEIVMEASVAMAGGVLMRVPDRDGNPIPLDEGSFTVQFQCDFEGFNDVAVRLRVMDLTSLGQHSREPQIFFFRKECAAGDKDIKGSALPNFFIGTSESRHDVIKNGEATPAWEIRGDKDEVETVIDSHIVDSEFYVSYDEKECMPNWQSASVVVFNPEVVEVEVIGDFAEDGLCLGKEPIKMTLQYACITAGTSIITVELSTNEIDDDRFTFSFQKRCTGMELNEGVSIEGLNIGTFSGGSNVVSDGITTDDFRNAGGELEEQVKNMAIYHADASRATFFVSTEFNEVVFRKPVLVLSRSWNDQGHRIALPTVEGSIVRAAKIDRYAPAQLDLVFNCQRNGSTDISVEIPIHPVGSLQFVVRKYCTVSANHVPFDGFTPNPVPGLNIGLSKYGASVIKDGLPTKNAEGMSLYHWENDIRDLRFFAPQTSFVTFYVSMNRTRHEGDAAIKLGAPELISSLNNARPMLSGRGSDGAVITQEGAYAAITVTFHCMSNGTAMYNLDIPLLPLTTGEVAPREEPIKIAFLHECGISKRNPKSGNGGVGINGFSIGTSKGGHEVVMNGFPTRLYYGQRTQDNPKWAPIIINENTDITTVYLHLNSETATSNNVDKMVFQPVTAVNHGHEVRPKLSGTAANGGELAVDGKALTLDIVWNCRYAGLGAVTIVIPVYPHGKVTFTIPKRCTGPSRPQAKQVEGLMVGTAENVADVIDNGVVASKYQNYRAYEMGSVFVYDDDSTFYIWTEGEEVLKALEPVVVSYRPLAVPQISHTMHVENGDATDEETAVDIEITHTPQPFTIFYNCVLIGTTAVTVVLPIMPMGSQVSFTVTKSCGSSEYDYTDAEYQSSMSSLYSWSAPSEYSGSWDASDSWSASSDYFSDYSGYRSDSSDYWNYEQNLDRSGAYSFSSSPSLDWDSIDEGRWNPVFDPEWLYERSGSLGWFNVGTGTDMDEIDDVVKEGVPTKAYAVPTSTVDTEEDDTTSAYTVIGRTRSTAQYFISLPRGSQTFEAPFAKVQPDAKGRTILSVALKGSSRFGGEISYTDAPMDLEVEFQCKKGQPGVARVIVSFPLVPANFVSFRILKVCGNFSPKIEWYWTASRIMILGTTMLILVGALCLYRTLKGNKNPYAVLPSSSTDAEGEGLLGKASNIDAFEEDVDSESD